MSKQQTKSVEERVEERYKAELDKLGVSRYTKTETTGNSNIDNALKQADSKSGGKGANYPDVKLVLIHAGRCMPVMIEAKGKTGKLEHTDRNGDITTDTKSVTGYAVNGAYHYAKAILDKSNLKEAICVGINGYAKGRNGEIETECKAYYVSEKNYCKPKLIEKITASDWCLFKNNNLARLFEICDELNLTEKEKEEIVKKKEVDLEKAVKDIHQSIYNTIDALTTNEKLYLFCGLIMAGLSNLGAEDLKSSEDEDDSDAIELLKRIKIFLKSKSNITDKVESILSLLKGVFSKEVLWKPTAGESILKRLYEQVKNSIIPLLQGELHLDVAGRILNSLNDWVQVENDKKNDVVLTPREVTRLMVELTRVNRNSFVLDTAMGSGGFLVSAMDNMIRDAKNKIMDTKELEIKVKAIKEKQLLGFEILSNIYLLAVLNMILMGDGSSNIKQADSLKELQNNTDFPTDVFLLNPPYSAEGNGLIFLDEALKQMKSGYACILIQDSAGSGQGKPYSANILSKASLLASIKMPADLFKTSVQTHIYLFSVGTKHDEENLVTFIDFSKDGFKRAKRNKSTQEVNLKDTDNATARYAEVVARVLGKKAETEYYTEKNGKLIKDTITLNGDDWNFGQHQIIDTEPTEADFKKVVADYLSWKVSSLLNDSGKEKKDIAESKTDDGDSAVEQ